MKILLIKTSSLGDLIHTLPALCDLHRHRPDTRVHWAIEEHFTSIGSWAPNVEQVIPVPLRRLRASPWRLLPFLRHFASVTRQRHDLILDAQGLLFKSALLAWLAGKPRHGFDRRSAREPIASFFYNFSYNIPTDLHAVARLRLLFAQALNLPPPDAPADFGLRHRRTTPQNDHLVFLHGTTWASKLWPESHWQALARRAQQENLTVLLPWGNPEEEQRAHRIRAAAPDVCRVLPRMPLDALATTLAGARGVVAVDSGPAHLAAALGTPTLCLYGPTPEARIGIVGGHVRRLSGPCPLAPCRKRACPLRPIPPCLAALDAETVWNALEAIP
ncbi:MAG: lipopolysaccharide heptosyltransferase I [Magnetococcales bacterium]|nr:lipopolysaccharide heptosyltransferase I [Magnetococcales bacterium]